MATKKSITYAQYIALLNSILPLFGLHREPKCCDRYIKKFTSAANRIVTCDELNAMKVLRSCRAIDFSEVIHRPALS